MKRHSKIMVIVCVVLVLVVLRLTAPSTIEYYLNEHRLVNLGDYTGQVDDVSLSVWRLAFRVENLNFEKVDGNQQVNFLIAPVVDVSVSRRALLKGAIRARIVMEEPELNFVDGEKEEERQAGAGLDLRRDPDAIFKLTIEEIEVHRGSVAFRNFTSEPPVNLQARKVDLTATNLTNVADEDGKRVATLKVTAEVFGDSPFSAKAEFDPFDLRSFLFACEFTLNDLTQINPFARAYANLDFESGEGKMVMELKAEDGMLTGYATPAFENVQIMDWQNLGEQMDNPLKMVWEGFSDLVSKVFTNPQTDRLATRIEISGDLPDSPDVDTWGAVFGIVRNAFAEAIYANFDHLTPLEVDSEEDSEEADED